MSYKYNILISDIETNAIKNWQTLDGLDRLHCFTVIDPTTSELYEFNTMKENIDGFYTQNSTIKLDNFNFLKNDFKIFEKFKLENYEKTVKEQISPENCDRNVRLGKKGEFGVFPFISFPGSGNT